MTHVTCHMTHVTCHMTRWVTRPAPLIWSELGMELAPDMSGLVQVPPGHCWVSVHRMSLPLPGLMGVTRGQRGESLVS